MERIVFAVEFFSLVAGAKEAHNGCFFSTSKAFSWSCDADLNGPKKISPVTFCKMSITNLLGCPLLFCLACFLCVTSSHACAALLRPSCIAWMWHIDPHSNSCP